MQVDAHPPCVSHSFAYSVGIVDDVEMRQGSTLWSPSRALVKKKKTLKNKLLYLERQSNCLIQHVMVTLTGFCYCSLNTVKPTDSQ